MIQTAVGCDESLIHRFGARLPAYATYPEATHFAPGFGYADYLQAVAALRARPGRHPLALAVQVPEAATRRGRLGPYMALLKREIDLHAALIGGRRPLAQLHVGGAAAGQLSDKQLGEVLQHLRAWLDVIPDAHGQYVMEAAAQHLSPERIAHLRSLGFNQVLIHAGPVRAGEDSLDELLLAARAARFDVVGVQVGWDGPATLAGLHAVTAAIYAAADRVTLESPDAGQEIWRCAVQRLLDAGYVSLGANQFVRQTDTLAAAQRQGRLFRDPYGFSAMPSGEWIGCGAGAISTLGGMYLQNADKLDVYEESIDNNMVPVARGLRLSLDDLMRRTLIHMILCNGAVSLEALEQAYPVVASSYFQRELAALEAWIAAGLVQREGDWITIAPHGRLLLPALAAVFDRYQGT